MAGEEAALGLLGGILALPYSIPQQNAEAQQAQRLQQALSQPGAITPAGGFSPEAMRAVISNMGPAPYKSAGSGIPVVGSILKGIGTTGRVIQSLAGTTSAPRPNDFLRTIQNLGAIQGRASAQEFREGQAKDLQQYREETLKFRESEGAENRALRREMADENIGLRRDTMGIAQERLNLERQRYEATGQKSPNRETLIGIASGYVQNPTISKEQAQGILDKENETRSQQKKLDLATRMQQGPLPQQTQMAVGRTTDIVHLTDELLKLLQTPEGKASVGVLTGRVGLAGYKLGVSKNPVADRLITLRERIKALGGGELMRGVSRAQQIYDKMTVHMPQPGDDESLVNDKLHATRDNLLDIAKELVNAAITPGADVAKQIETMQASPTEGLHGETPELDELNQILEQHGH